MPKIGSTLPVFLKLPNIAEKHRKIRPASIFDPSTTMRFSRCSNSDSPRRTKHNLVFSLPLRGPFWAALKNYLDHLQNLKVSFKLIQIWHYGLRCHWFFEARKASSKSQGWDLPGVHFKKPGKRVPHHLVNSLPSASQHDFGAARLSLLHLFPCFCHFCP